MAVSVPFRSIQHVYFDDLDALNILHNVRFLLFIERARGEMFNAMGFHWQDDLEHNPDKFHVVAEHSIRYRAPVRGEGDLCVELSVAHLGTTSMIIAAKVESPDGKQLFAEGTTRLVRLDPATFRPASWSEKMRAVVSPLVVAAKA